MKTATINNVTYGFVTVPESAHNFSIRDVAGKPMIRFEYTDKNRATACRIKYISIPDGGILVGSGRCSELTEEQAAGIVEVVHYDIMPSPANDFCGDWDSAYRDYNNEEEAWRSEYPFVKTAVASLRSLCSSLECAFETCVIVKLK